MVVIFIVEIGGTVGDIESLPFLEAIRQMNFELEQNQIFYIHMTLIPWIESAQELKTKPTQHSVTKLREIGYNQIAKSLKGAKEKIAFLEAIRQMNFELEFKTKFFIFT